MSHPGQTQLTLTKLAARPPIKCRTNSPIRQPQGPKTFLKCLIHKYSTNIYRAASRGVYDIKSNNNNDKIAHMQQEDFIRAQSAQAQADQGHAQQQNAYMQDPNVQHQYMQNLHTQNPPMQNPGMQFADMQDPNSQPQNQYLQQHASLQTPFAQNPQNSTSLVETREGDFLHAGHTYNIHALHALIDARHPNSPLPSNRGPNAFALPSHGAYGPHNAPARPPPRLGPNGRPMVKLQHFGRRGEWVEMPDPQAYRRDTEENRAERERNMAADLEFVERNPYRLGPTWRPSWRRWW